MAYSDCRQSYWSTGSLTGSPFISGSQLYVRPRSGQEKTFFYHQLDGAEIDEQWVAEQFPTVDQKYRSELVRFTYTFIDDMKHNVYRYAGFKNPLPVVGCGS